MAMSWTIMDSAEQNYFEQDLVCIMNKSRNVRCETVQQNKEAGVRVERVFVETAYGCSKYYIKSFYKTPECAKTEAEVAARINHPGFVKVLAYRVSSRVGQVLMPDVGPTALCWSPLLPHGPMQMSLGLYATVWSLLCALEHIEGLGIVHRDLKPGNIAGPRRTIIDLSTAADLSTFGAQVRQGLAAALVGTDGFMAPEVAALMASSEEPSWEQVEQVTTSKADVYSFGVIVYGLITGCLPPPAASDCPLLPPALSPHWPHLQLLLPLVASCLEADPRRRPTFAQLRQQARAWMEPCAQAAREGSGAAFRQLRAADAASRAFYQSPEVAAQLRGWAGQVRSAAQRRSLGGRLRLWAQQLAGRLAGVKAVAAKGGHGSAASTPCGGAAVAAPKAADGWFARLLRAQLAAAA